MHEDIHFDSAVSNIDSANSSQKARAGGKVSQVLFLVLPMLDGGKPFVGVGITVLGDPVTAPHVL